MATIYAGGKKGFVDTTPQTGIWLGQGPNAFAAAPTPAPAAPTPAPAAAPTAAPVYSYKPPTQQQPSAPATPTPPTVPWNSPGTQIPINTPPPAPTPVTPPTPTVEYYGRLVPGQNPIPVISGWGGPVSTPQNPNAPSGGGTVPTSPTVPTQGPGRKGWDAQGNYWHNPPANVVIYPNPPADAFKATPSTANAAGANATPSRTLASQTVNVNGVARPKYQIDYNYYPTPEEIARYGGMQNWIDARNRGEVAEALQEISYNSGSAGNSVGVTGMGLDMNGNVIMAGSQSGYADDIGKNIYNDPSVVNNWVGSGQLNTDFQDTVRNNPNMSAAEVHQLSKYHTEVQQAYRMGMVDEQTARAAYTILANDAVTKYQERVAKEQLAATPHIQPPQTGSAGLATTGGMNQPTGYLANGTPYYGRPLEEISASGTYNSPEERLFFLNSIGKTLDDAGNVVPLGMPSAPSAASSVANALSAAPSPVTGSGRASWSDWGELPGGQLAQWAVNNGYSRDQIIYQGQSQFPPEVEQWRGLVSKYFAPEDVNHALWLIQRESGGQNIVQHGGGPGTGLFQVEHGGQWPGRPSQEALLDPETNIAYAAGMVYGR